MDPVNMSIILTAIGWLAKSIFSKAVDVAWKQFTKGVGLDSEIDELIAELESFQVPVETTDHTTNYLKKVKELVHEAEDLLDELDYFRLQNEVKHINKAEQGSIFNRMKSSSSNDVPSSSTGGTFKELKFDKKGISKKMKTLIRKLKEKKCEPLNPGLQLQLLYSIGQTVDNQAVQVDRQKTTSYRLENEIYGRSCEIEQIQKLINYAEQRLHKQKVPVIAIVGNGGVGKTTLAQRAYNHLTVEFDLRIWICVSTNFDDMRFTCQMLECCSDDGRKCDGQNLNNLKNILTSKLTGKKVLLVLDDIWEIKSKSEWNSLLAPLNSSTGTMVGTKAGTVVLVTTRFPSIAEMVEAIDPIISLDGLDESSSWSLFRNCVFGNDQYDVPDIVENIGRRIVNRLRGYPLATKTIGALLKRNTDVVYWTKILESEQWKFLEGKDDIMPTLKLSYEYLPVHLKKCFSYCSLFPKDYYFKAEELVHMWMALDYICTNGKRVEDVGFEYLQILIERAFFQRVNTKWGEMYVIHDLMHDLAQIVSSEEFLAINHLINFGIPPNFQCHHLSFLVDMEHTIEGCVQFHNLSSLVIFENDRALKDTLNWDHANRVHLRLLILPFIRSISYNFSYFTHLRYLKLNLGESSYGYEKIKFPVQICRLYHLQVLQLEESLNYAEELPKEFNNLVNLRHFIANETLHSKIIGVGRLKHLQELKKFVVREEKGFELGQLSELKELRRSLQIYGLQNVKCREEAERVRLSEKKIVKLALYWNLETDDKPYKNRGGKGKWRTWVNREGRKCKITNPLSEEILEALRPNSELRDLHIKNYGGCHSPSWMTDHSIKYVESIYVSNCESWEELPNFGQLMFLKELYMHKLPRVKALGPQFHGCSPQQCFPSLKVMTVIDMGGLETWAWPWSRWDKVFPSLVGLYIRRCPKLSELSIINIVPVHGEDSEWFPKLQDLIIDDCPQLQQIPQTFGFPRRVTVVEINVGFGRIQYSRSDDKLIIKHVMVPVFDFTLHFKNLCSVEVNDCPKLTFFPWKCICMLYSLKRLKFRSCPLLDFSAAVQEEKDDGISSYSHKSLQQLEINECGISGEELSNLLAHLPSIWKLTIEECHGIYSVLLPNIIYEPNRASLEAGVNIDIYQQQNPDSLAHLEELNINNCPNMFIVNEEGLLGLTALRKVEIHGSDELLYSLNLKEGRNYVHTLIVKDSNVTLLKLHSFAALKMLELRYCKYLAAVEGPPVCPDVIIRKCPQLAKTKSQIERKFLMPVAKLDIEFLSIHNCSFSMSPQSLIINGGYDLSGSEKWREWTEDQENALIKHFTVLEKLTLYWCHDLRSLPSTLHLHPSLKELTIENCHQIKSLPEKGFPESLQKIRLWSCSEELRSQCSQLENSVCFTETDEYVRKYLVFVKTYPSVNRHHRGTTYWSTERQLAEDDLLLQYIADDSALGGGMTDDKLLEQYMAEHYPLEELMQEATDAEEDIQQCLSDDEAVDYEPSPQSGNIQNSNQPDIMLIAADHRETPQPDRPVVHQTITAENGKSQPDRLGTSNKITEPNSGLRRIVRLSNKKPTIQHSLKRTRKASKLGNKEGLMRPSIDNEPLLIVNLREEVMTVNPLTDSKLELI